MTSGSAARRRRQKIAEHLESYQPEIAFGRDRHGRSVVTVTLSTDAVDALLTIRDAATWFGREERRVISMLIGSGMTWAEVGEALGVSRQAAHARYAAFVEDPGR